MLLVNGDGSFNHFPDGLRPKRHAHFIVHHGLEFFLLLRSTVRQAVTQHLLRQFSTLVFCNQHHIIHALLELHYFKQLQHFFTRRRSSRGFFGFHGGAILCCNFSQAWLCEHHRRTHHHRQQK